MHEAFTVARMAHAGQRDKQGRPALNHVVRVSAAGRTPDERVVGMLHDVVEDSTITVADLRAHGFPDHIVAAVDAITRRKGDETYAEYIERVAGNPLARQVKLYDLEENMTRDGAWQFPSLVARYRKAKARLDGVR